MSFKSKQTLLREAFEKVALFETTFTNKQVKSVVDFLDNLSGTYLFRLIETEPGKKYVMQDIRNSDDFDEIKSYTVDDKSKFPDKYFTWIADEKSLTIELDVK